MTVAGSAAEHNPHQWVPYGRCSLYYPNGDKSLTIIRLINLLDSSNFLDLLLKDFKTSN